MNRRGKTQGSLWEGKVEEKWILGKGERKGCEPEKARIKGRANCTRVQASCKEYGYQTKIVTRAI